MSHAVTFPFFAEQIGFRNMDITKKAKYLLFFVTEVVKLREDGMELDIICERLRDKFGKQLDDAERQQIKDFFERGGEDHEIRKIKREDEKQAYKILSEKGPEILKELEAGLRVFLSYKSEFGYLAKDIANVLRSIGIKTWLDIEDLSDGNISRAISKGIGDSCLIVFLITEGFEDKTWIRDEIEIALHRKTLHAGRFSILPIVLHDEGKPVPRVPEMLASRMAYKMLKVRDRTLDVEIVRLIVSAMPVQLGITQWKTP